MKLYEKIALIFVAVTFLLQFLHGENIDEDIFLPFLVSTWGLMLSYFFAGIWLFNSDWENKKFFLPIISGIAFGLAIFIIPFYLKLNYDDFLTFFPIPCAILCLCLAIYWIVNRKTDKISTDLRTIFVRSVIILIISCFFVSVPKMYAPHRILLKAVIHNKYLFNNILAFEYGAKSEKALKNDDCEEAIKYALKANEAGRIWLGLEDDEDIDYAINCLNRDTLILWDIERKLYSIGATYHLLYRVYRCKADKEWNNEQYKESLKNYETAHKYLLVHEVVKSKEMSEAIKKEWTLEIAFSLKSIAGCYKKLKQYDMANSLYLGAIQHYLSVTEENDKDLAMLYQDLASSLSEAGEYYYSNCFHTAASGILLNDTVSEENRNYLAGNLNEIAVNYYRQDSITNALHYLKQAERFINKKGDELCYNLFFKGLCTYKLNEYAKADSILKTCLQCYQNQSKHTEQNAANVKIALAQINTALAKYDEARKYANEGLETIEKIFGKNHLKYAEFLRYHASLNKITGDYSTAYQQYKQIIGAYTRELEYDNSTLAVILSDFAALEVILSNLESAKQYSDKALSMIPDSMLIYPSVANFLNNAAYINYCFGLYKQADTLYKRAISINNEYNLPFEPTSATALNGLGLIETANKNYKKADSLFAQSLSIYSKWLPHNHPLIANVYLNWGILQINENKLAQAEEKINKSLKINKLFFKNDHDVFADILTAQGNIAKKRGQNDIAKTKYQQALTIYKKHFTAKHWKIVETERKMKSF